MTCMDGLWVRPTFCLPSWEHTNTPQKHRDQSNVKISGAPDADKMQRKLSSVHWINSRRLAHTNASPLLQEILLCKTFLKHKLHMLRSPQLTPWYSIVCEGKVGSRSGYFPAVWCRTSWGYSESWDLAQFNRGAMARHCGLSTVWLFWPRSLQEVVSATGTR